MSMTKKIKCPYHGDGELASMFPYIDKHPFSCPCCRGTLEYDITVRLPMYRGTFTSLDWEKIDDYQDDVYAGFKCPCGDEISLSEGGEMIVCSCGRIYRLSFYIRVDESHMGDTEFLVAESEKRE